MLNPPTSDRPPRVHFSGIGGIAMVAGARLAVEAGWDVRGSDQPLYPPASDMAAALGVPVAEEYAAENLEWDPDVVVVGNALSRGNAEIESILERGLCYTSLPEWLKNHVLRARQPIVIAGTHGKTTTTTLTSFVLDRAGQAPGFLIGGQPKDFEHPCRLGSQGGLFVIEGDEYDTAFFDKRAKFFHYLPRIAVVTSVEFDHGDIYRDIGEIEVAFQRMLRQIPKSGHLILCADDTGARKLREHAYCQVLTYGFDEDADWQIRNEGSYTDGEIFSVVQGDKTWGPFRVALFGTHNLRNTLAAIVVGAINGASVQAIGESLAQFSGITRRMEIFHESNGTIFVDDFAHHPTAIKETLLAASARWPDNKLTVLFEPRSNTTATRVFQGELPAAFAPADEVWIGPIYRPHLYSDDERLDKPRLQRDIEALGVQAHCVDDVEEIVSGLKQSVGPNTTVLVCSNGAFGGIYDRLKDAFR